MRFNVSKYLKYLDNINLGKNIEYIEETESTNDDLWDRIDNQEDYIIIADSQKKGRGRRGNSWYSVKQKSLTFSIGLKNNSIDNFIGLRVSLALCMAINRISNINARIKWPNDIVVNNKKISGILIESKIKKTMTTYNIGIGINVNLNIDELNPNLKNNMSSIFIETNKIQNRELLLSEFIKSLILTNDDDDIINNWMMYCSHINKQVTFHNESEKISGTFLGLNLDGKAIMKNNSTLEYYSTGTLEL